MVFDLMPTDTDDDVAVIGRRMAAVPAALAGYRESLLLAAAAGQVAARPADRQVRRAVRHLRRSGSGTGFFAGLAASLDPDGKRGPELSAALARRRGRGRCRLRRTRRVSARRTAAVRAGQGRRRPGAVRPGLP